MTVARRITGHLFLSWRCRAAKQRDNNECCRIVHFGPYISFCRCSVERKSGRIPPVNYWEIIADNLGKAGWNCGCISSTDQKGRQFWVAAAGRSDAGRFIVRADEKLAAFLELGSAIRACKNV